MIILVALMALCVLINLKVRVKDIDVDYMSKDKTFAVKGCFIIIVFMSHIRSYTTFEGFLDNYVIKLLDYMGQLMVAMFLFYSGFGVYESIKKKGYEYVKNIPIGRVLKTFINLFIAILLFLCVDIWLGIEVEAVDVLLAPTGWTSIGNSNWYMFAIFTLYILTFICFTVFKNNRVGALSIFAMLSIVYILIIQRSQGSWWCDTYLCYFAGMLYSHFKEKIDVFLGKNNKAYFLSLFSAGIAFIVCFIFKYNSVWIYNILAVIFSVLIVLLSMKISFKNLVLIWCGKNLFWLYILQRIPMIIFKYFGVHKNNYLYLVLCIVITVVLSMIMDKLTKLVRKHTKFPL